MDIAKLIAEIIAEKAQATNKDKMGLLVDKALEALTVLKDLPLDERSTAAVKSLEEAYNDFRLKADETVQTLKDENQTLREQLSQVGTDYDGIVADIKKENESLQEQITDQDDEIESLHIQLKEAEELLQEALQAYNTAAVQPANNLETEVGGKRVQVNFGVHHNGVQYSAADLAESPEVVEELIAIGSGSITILED